MGVLGLAAMVPGVGVVLVVEVLGVEVDPVVEGVPEVEDPVVVEVLGSTLHVRQCTGSDYYQC